MNNPSSFARFESLVVTLLASVTDIINAKVQEAVGKAVPVSQPKSEVLPLKDIPTARFVGFNDLAAVVPLSQRTLRKKIKRGTIPAIRMAGGRRLLFHIPSVERALLRFQRGGIPE